MGKVRVKSNMNQVLKETESKNTKAFLVMATDIHRIATMLAPYDTGALVNSGMIDADGNGEFRITFGSKRVPYALMRHYVNKSNPQTLLYLERAGDAVFRNMNKYLAGIR